MNGDVAQAPYGYIKPSLSENLLSTKKRLEEELDKVNKALDLLQEETKVAEVLEALSKLNLIRY